jgi:hypothetical protein
LLLGIFIFFWSSECEDCTKSTYSTVTAVNLTENDVKEISQMMFSGEMFQSLNEKFPKYAGTFEKERITYNIRTQVDTTNNVSQTQFKIGFKYKGFEGKKDPSIVDDAELISRFLVEKLGEIIKPYAYKKSDHEVCES